MRLSSWKNSKGGFEEQRRKVALARAGPHCQREGVVVERQGGNRRPVVRLRIVNPPADGVGLPHIPGIVADDVAIDALHAARHDLVGQVFDGRQRIAR